MKGAEIGDGSEAVQSPFNMAIPSNGIARCETMVFLKLEYAHRNIQTEELKRRISKVPSIVPSNWIPPRVREVEIPDAPQREGFATSPFEALSVPIQRDSRPPFSILPCRHRPVLEL